MSKLTRDEIQSKIDALKGLNYKEAKALRKRLESELNKADKAERKKAEKAPIISTDVSKPFMTLKRIQGYDKVHGKLRSYHSLIRQLRKNYFPDLSYREVQRRVKNRRERNDIDPYSGIQDSYWENISP